VGGASKWKNDAILEMESDDASFTLYATIAERLQGSYILRLWWSAPALTFAEVLHHTGKVPLPPYLRRTAEQGDEDTYQTIFAKDEGSVAAPTAGLHFTDHVMHSLAAKGVNTSFVTLHVGAGTFIPVKAETMDGHNMHAEWIEVTQTTLQQLLQAAEKKVVAVGTTSMRTLESLYWIGNKLMNGEALNLHDIAVYQWDPYREQTTHSTEAALTALLAYMQQHQMERLITRTQILIAPGYTCRIISGLVTNFHQPQSTLLLLVGALIGNNWRNIYNHALQHDFRFLSYGDGCLLWKDQ
jgi:S-adenosylmethionine:tRNA ribosyltransferase-isomerase